MTNMHNIEQIEKIATSLDRLIRQPNSAEFDLNSVQRKLDEFASAFTNEKYIPRGAFVAYEAQGLIHWLNRDPEQSYSFMQEAVSVKGDSVLLTQSGNEIYNQYSQQPFDPTDEADEDPWTTYNTIAVVLVALFWIITTIIVLTDSKITPGRKLEIIAYGTMLLIGLWIFFSVIGTLSA